MSTLITADYQGLPVSFTKDGWFNATAAASRFGKQAGDWLKTDAAREYIAALCRRNTDTKNFVSVKKGGISQGTWMHPKLAVVFARWLDADLAVWCDETIDSILRGKHPALDWTRLRHKAAATYKVMSVALEEGRKELGKETERHHYMNEAKLVNWAVFGSFASVDRDALHPLNLDLLAAAEMKNTLLIAKGYTYDLRKPLLKRFVDEERARLTVKLEAPAA
jgi:hypothetical protein